MIGIDPQTGRTVNGTAALQCRFERVLTTSITSRAKRRTVGNRAIERLGNIQSPTEAMILQNLTLEALANPANGLTSFTAKLCRAESGKNGFYVRVSGEWNGKPLELKGRV
ncbi:phage baseplate protein [Photobacterium minamisatsumaniensis]|uniref:phage baseplate protein n=1 Tax=Photobacterium minamisatsumaniensis TaxID=2910233 RepID=UPI003D0D2F34